MTRPRWTPASNGLPIISWRLSQPAADRPCPAGREPCLPRVADGIPARGLPSGEHFLASSVLTSPSRCPRRQGPRTGHLTCQAARISRTSRSRSRAAPRLPAPSATRKAVGVRRGRDRGFPLNAISGHIYGIQPRRIGRWRSGNGGHIHAARRRLSHHRGRRRTGRCVGGSGVPREDRPSDESHNRWGETKIRT